MENITQTSPESDSSIVNLVDLTGQTLADYHILRKLGQGGMGQVYLAEQVSLKRKVALKLLKAELAANEVALKRFKQEAEAVARVTHANIVQVYNIGEANGQHYMALEYVEGRNLRDYITRKGPPELLLALSIMRQTAGALQRAAELGIIHRDIKPENILLTRKGEVKVADFGLSRALEGDQPAVSLTQSGVTMGTPLYMSPEQVEGKPLDPRTDIYSFGVTCYHMFAGEPPFRGSTAFEVALQHVRSDPTPLDSIRPDLPAEVCAVVHKMMAKDPGQRYQSGRELLKDLVRLRESINGNTGFLPLAATGFVDQPIGGSAPSSKSVPLVTPKRRRGWLVALFFLSMVAAGAGGAYFGFNQQKNRSPADEEAAEVEPRLAIESTPLLDSEQMFKKLVDQHLNPARGFDNPKSSLHDCLRLAVVYLDNDKLDEAESLFERMEGVHQVELYHVTGKLGKAMVLSLRDKWNASHEAFRDLQMDRKKPVDIPRAQTLTEILRTNLGFTRWLKEAVHRNEVNSKGAVDKTMPQYLRFLARKDVPRPSDKPPKDNKPGPKKPDPQTMP